MSSYLFCSIQLVRLFTHADDSRAGVYSSPPSVCLFVCVCVCLSVCPPESSATTDARVTKLGGEVDPRVPCPNLHFEVKRSKVKVTGSISAFFTFMAIT